MKTITQSALGKITSLSCLLFFMLSSFQSMSQGWRTTTTEATNLCSFFTTVAQTSDGGFLAASNYLDTTTFSQDIRMYKLDQDGNVLWSKEIHRSKNILVKDLVACSDGNFLMVGRVDSVNYHAGLAIKVNSSADLIWEKEFNVGNLPPSITYNLSLKHTIESEFGGFLITGETYNISGTHLFLHKLDETGSTSWATIYNDYDFGTSIVENPDSSIMVTGNTRLSAPPGILKFSATGTLLWVNNHVYSNKEIYSIVRTSSGYYTGNMISSAIALEKLDFNGNVIWSKFIPFNFHYLNKMLQTKDDHLFFAGYDSGGAVAIKTDTLGNVFWRQEVSNNKGFQYAAETDNGGFVCSGINLGPSTTKLFNGVGYSVEFAFDCGIFNEDYNCDYTPSQILAIPTIPVSSPPYTYIWSNGAIGPTLSACPNRLYQVTITDVGGATYTAEISSNAPSNNKVQIVLFNSKGISYSNQITGYVALDDNLDCAISPSETGMLNHMIRVDGDESFVTRTDINGFYRIGLDSGSYSVTYLPPNQLFQSCIPSNPFAVNSLDSMELDFPLNATECPLLHTNLESIPLRRCTTTTFYVGYQNRGAIDAYNTYIELTFDNLLTVTGSSIPWTSQSGNTYVFNLGTVPYNTPMQTFTVNTDVSCSAIQGQSLCVSAEIFPDSLCLPPSTSWDGSITEIESSCNTDSLTFTIKNIGTGPMVNPQDFYIVEDNAILKTGNFNLLPIETKEIKVVSNGSTYRIYAGQSPGYFDEHYKPTEVVEGCGVNSSGTFSVGFLNSFPFTDNISRSVELCPQIVGPLDPNDKSAVPTGYGPDHYVDQNIDLDYLIRFQNVGTDTAFNVVIRDTLSEHLDITSLQQGLASHNYQLDIIGNNILKFTFPNIKLVDSTANEPGSHGFVSYKISQQDSLSLGTMIYNSAAIYFDYEAPVITNETWHEVGEFITMISSPTEEISSKEAPSVKVFPNPFNEYADIVIEDTASGTKTLRVCDAVGRERLNVSLTNNRYRIYRNQLPAGMYFFTITKDNQFINTGKFIIR